MTAIRPLVAGNWKMNGLGASLAEIASLLDRLAQNGLPPTDIMVCPPATLLTKAKLMLEGGPVTLGAQDCHPLASGAHTGDLSAEMLADAGAKAIIVGHSERRTDHGETDAMVNAKTQAAHRAGLSAIICVGETEQERRNGATLEVVQGQLAGSVPRDARAANTVIAYEPVWAIGSGLTPTQDDVAEVHAVIRAELTRLIGEEGTGVRILYGGSVKPGNARELLQIANVNGALVGGASLKAEDFYTILCAY
ncbi:MAG: triose-phosphate isomerase [Methyloceanibacter sp.]|uniref:triose-phosphate isomerase n=1 Tax=Methyloceanibacter sp. TaxID=1965321 RepID=UPI003D9B2B1E